MDQQQTIFDEHFENQVRPRRRDIMPKWLTIYTWCIIVFGVVSLIWTAFFAPDYNANDPQAADPETGRNYRIGASIGHFIPGVLFLLMGLLVWLEVKRAIRFNWGIIIFWMLMIVYATFASGLRGLTVGMLMPLFIPYWIGLLGIQRKWEKEAIAGKRRS